MEKFAHPRWIIGILIAAILSLEIILPNEYVVSYGYVVPILFASYKLNSRWAKWVTVIAVSLTLLFCVDLDRVLIDRMLIDRIFPVVFFNRILAAIALIVSYRLSIEIRTYSELAANSQAELIVQSRLGELRTAFTASLVHDLQNPLLGAIETINTFLVGDFGAVTTEQKHALGVMSRAHKMSINNLQTILETCRNDNHGLYLNYQPSNLALIATEAIDALIDMAKNRQVQIELVDESRTSQVECDPDKLERVFTNLLLNAINQSPPQSKILISINEESTQYLVRVIDRGKGIKAEDLPYIFVKFYQGSIGRRAKSAGLGLYLVRQIIEAHGGTIDVEPTVSKGVTFLFTLPKSASEA
jgi:two-component system, NarL family, sensor kinase